MSLSTAIFGSCARGEFDDLSDRDFLIVGDTADEISAATDAVRDRGYSCSTYTWQKLRHLAGQGSLFIAHLKYEAVIIDDPSRQLRDLLSSFTPRMSYENLKQDSHSLLRLLKAVPSSFRGRGWAYDILFTAFRTYAVPYLAERGHFKFSHRALVEWLIKAQPALETHQDALLRLRRIKHAFREASDEVLRVTEASVEEAACALTAIVQQDIVIQHVGPYECLRYSLEELSLPRRKGYLNLRSIERSAVALEDVQEQELMPELAVLRRQICSPAAYSFGAYPGRRGHKAAVHCLEQLRRELHDTVAATSKAG